MTTTAPLLLAGRYAVADDRIVEPDAYAMTEATDTELDRPVTVVALPATRSASGELRQRWTADGNACDGDGLADVLDIAEDGRRAYLILAPGQGELLGELLRRGPLSTAAAARIALDVLTARTSLRAQGRSAPATVDPYTVLVHAGGAARLIPLPCDSAPAVDDISPVYGLYATMTSAGSGLDDGRAPQDPPGEVDRPAEPPHAPDAPGGDQLSVTLDDPAAQPPSPDPSWAGWATPLAAAGYDAAGSEERGAAPPPPDQSWTDMAAAADDGPAAWLPTEPEPEGDTVRIRAGGRRRPQTLIVGLATALSLLVLATVLGVAWFRPAPPPAPRSGPVPTSVPAPPRPAPPATVPGLLAALTRDPTAAGADGPRLRDGLTAVTSSTGETRRQNAVRVLALAANGRLSPEYASAAVAATTPSTVLNAPVDIIADLAPDPAAGGPNAHYVLNCMLEFQGKSADNQRDEATELLTKIQSWARNGGIQPDLVAAVIRIVTPVAHGTAVFTDAQTGFDPKRPQPPT